MIRASQIPLSLTYILMFQESQVVEEPAGTKTAAPRFVALVQFGSLKLRFQVAAAHLPLPFLLTLETLELEIGTD